MTEIISFLFDEYVTKIYMVVDFVKPKDKYYREMYFFCFFTSSLFTIFLTLASSVKYFSDISSTLKNIFDHFLKLISGLFNFVLLLIAPPFVICVWLFVGAFIIGLFGFTYLLPLTHVIVDYKYNTLIEQIYVYSYIWISLNFAFFLLGILSLVSIDILSFLNGEKSSEFTLTWLWVEIKKFLSNKYSNNYALNLLSKLAIFLLGIILFGFIAPPLSFIGFLNLIIIPFAFIRFAFRGIVRAIRS